MLAKRACAHYTCYNDYTGLKQTLGSGEGSGFGSMAQVNQPREGGDRIRRQRKTGNLENKYSYIAFTKSLSTTSTMLFEH